MGIIPMGRKLKKLGSLDHEAVELLVGFCAIVLFALSLVLLR
jgi:hypothetical protein